MIEELLHTKVILVQINILNKLIWDIIQGVPIPFYYKLNIEFSFK